MLEKEKILHYSRQKFFSDGISKVTMDEIAKELKMSKKTLYKHFPSKCDLASEAIFDMTNTIKKSISEIINSPIDSVTKLHRISQMFFGFAKTFSDKWLNDIRLNHHGLWLKIDEFRVKALMENFTKVLEQGKKEGHFVDRPTPIVMAALIGAVRGVINPEFLMNNSFSAQNAAEHTLDMLFSSLLTKKGRKLYKKIKSENKL